jgi:hypothetical protein
MSRQMMTAGATQTTAPCEMRVCAPPDCAEQLAENNVVEWGFHV